MNEIDYEFEPLALSDSPAAVSQHVQRVYGLLDDLSREAEPPLRDQLDAMSLALARVEFWLDALGTRVWAEYVEGGRHD